MKPLYITYSDESQPYFRMAKEICQRVEEFDAGNCIHICQSKPEEEKNFEVAIYTKIFVEVEKVIAKRPVMILDADHILRKPIIEVFDGDWDIGAIYRRYALDEYGRHDFCGGLALLNNRRPDCIKRFCYDWLKSMSSRPPSPDPCSERLKQQGWDDTWFDGQASLNEVIAIDDEVKHGVIYTTNGYWVLPLKNEEYGKKGTFINHLKGTKKLK